MDSPGRQQMQNHTETASDHELVEQCKQGDQEAFGELVFRHHRAALKVALSIVRDRQDAEDEVQNAFWKAYQHIGQFNQDAKFSTWLTRIVVNQCLMRLRRSRRARHTYIDDVLAGEEIVSLDLKDPRVTPEQELGQTEVAKVLFQEIRKAPPLLRQVFLLRDVQQLPMPDVAAALGISIAAAKSRLLRARAEIRLRMSRHCGQTGAASLTA
jgi:RNA polymerase sigma-70 factor (ECF subfamily)